MFNLAPFKYRLVDKNEGPVGMVDSYGVMPPQGTEIQLGDSVYVVLHHRHILARERNGHVLISIDVVAAKKEGTTTPTTPKE
jgi:hypothetical protein